MKQFFRNSTLILLAGMVLLVGSGVNYVHYCCHECSMKGIGEIAKELCTTDPPAATDKTTGADSCCAKEHDTPSTMSCGHMLRTDKKDCCTVTRLQIDLNDQIAKISINADFTWHAALPNNALLINPVECPVTPIEKIYPPPLSSSRQLLSLKSVLLI